MMNVITQNKTIKNYTTRFSTASFCSSGIAKFHVKEATATVADEMFLMWPLGNPAALDTGNSRLALANMIVSRQILNTLRKCVH